MTEMIQMCNGPLDAEFKMLIWTYMLLFIWNALCFLPIKKPSMDFNRRSKVRIASQCWVNHSKRMSIVKKFVYDGIERKKHETLKLKLIISFEISLINPIDINCVYSYITIVIFQESIVFLNKWWIYSYLIWTTCPSVFVYEIYRLVGKKPNDNLHIFDFPDVSSVQHMIWLCWLQMHSSWYEMGFFREEKIHTF